MKLPRLSDMDNRAVSPIIGIVLIVALTVGVGAIAGAAFLNSGGSITTSTAPQTTFDSDVTGFSVESNFTITFGSGETIPADELEIQTETVEEPIPVTELTDEEQLSSGDTITISALDDQFNTTSDTIRLVWTDESLTGSSSTVLFERTIGESDITGAQGDIVDEVGDDFESECGDLIIEDGQIVQA